MTQKSSFFLAVLLVANPFMLLFFQNCSAFPHGAKENSSGPEEKAPTPPSTKEVVSYHFKKAL